MGHLGEKEREGPGPAKKGSLLYEGKGKKVYQALGRPEQVILFFKDDLSAGQGRKKGSFPGKGAICKSVSSLIFKRLKKEGMDSHWLEDLSPKEALCLKMEILPLETVVRNRLAGSSAERFGLPEGRPLKKPLLEFYYKNDGLDDPFASEEQIKVLELIKQPAFLPQIKEQALLINKKLGPFFLEAGLELIDFKIEFGLFEGRLLPADDISPDSCRIWDSRTGFRLDKDRFRRGWGQVKESYKIIEKKLYEKWEGAEGGEL